MTLTLLIQVRPEDDLYLKEEKKSKFLFSITSKPWSKKILLLGVDLANSIWTSLSLHLR